MFSFLANMFFFLVTLIVALYSIGYSEGSNAMAELIPCIIAFGILAGLSIGFAIFFGLKDIIDTHINKEEKRKNQPREEDITSLNETIKQLNESVNELNRRLDNRNT